MYNFNPRSHEGSDRIYAPSASGSGVFQSTLPRGERRNFCRSVCQKGDFNPRSHEGSDTILLLYQAGHRISIHAPTRGATIKRAISMPNLKFQSTLPRGERPSPQVLFHPIQTISIHAPTRGATLLLHLLVPQTQNFNPRSHEGSDRQGLEPWTP